MELLPNNEDTAARIRIARGLVKQSLKNFCEKHGFNRYTIESWEMGHHGISPSMLTRFCAALSAEGIFCAPEWLLKGKGAAPIQLGLREDLPFKLSSSMAQEQRNLLQSEIQLFRENQVKIQREPVAIEISDQAMKPFYAKGDYVGGYLVPERSVDILLGQIAIVGIGRQAYVVRRLMKEGSNYLLIPADFTERAVSIKKPENIARIIWHRAV